MNGPEIIAKLILANRELQNLTETTSKLLKQLGEHLEGEVRPASPAETAESFTPKQLDLFTESAPEVSRQDFLKAAISYSAKNGTDKLAKLFGGRMLSQIPDSELGDIYANFT